MTTGATIHTTQGLKMTVTRRTKPPIVPILETTMLKVDETGGVSKENPVISQKGEVSPAPS